ncbi:MAG: glycosyltransferase family 2 protein [Chloroflexi bacterium]|nr:MAG: glycosyltransferase family 2 protein [Chloroflexota bacterium]
MSDLRANLYESGDFDRPARPTCTAIVCAYNEEKYLAGVLDGLLKTPSIQEIIVVDDGSQDRTAEIIRQYGQIERIHPIFLSPNHGKGFAMAEAAAAARGDVLLFVDADLVNWDAGYAARVLAPILAGQADLVIGYPQRETDPWDTADVLHVQRWLSGERAVWRTDLLPILSKLRPSRFGVETLINMHYRTRHQPIRFVRLEGLLHVIKFEKSSRAEAWDEYVKEVQQILSTYARHPLLTIMTYVPDFIDLRDALLALYGLMRRSIPIMTF